VKKDPNKNLPRDPTKSNNNHYLFTLRIQVSLKVLDSTTRSLTPEASLIQTIQNSWKTKSSLRATDLKAILVL